MVSLSVAFSRSFQLFLSNLCPICVNFSFFVLTTVSSGTTLYVNNVARWISPVKHDYVLSTSLNFEVLL